MTRLKHHESVRHIMTDNPTTVNLKTKISEIAKLFAQSDFRHLPVVDGDKLVGMVSFNDMLRISYGDAFDQDQQTVWEMLDHTKTIEDVMTREPNTLSIEANVRDAAELLSDSTFSAVPIVDAEDKLIGIVTSTDLIRFLVDLY